MFNVTILKIKDIAKIIIILAIIYILYIFCIKNNFIKRYLNQSIDIVSSDFLETCVNTQSNIIKNVSKQNIIEEQTEEVEANNTFEVTTAFKIASNLFIAKELATTSDSEENIDTTKEINDTKENETNSENKEIDDTSETEGTEVVTENPIADNYNTEYNGVKIKNGTSYELTDEILNTDDLDINTENVIIFHTHTCESYTQTDGYTYESSGNYRTTDLNYSVARVGDELASYLEEYGFNVNHDKTYHDYPSYNGSYSRSLQTVQSILQTFSSDIIIDLHRDAIGSDETYAPLVKIGDDYCAQLMFVIGTDGGGLLHPNWNSNLKFAIKIQEKANELYPGLFKTIVLRNSRYNQHLGKAACIIEVGATGNTMEQTLLSMKYLAKVMNEALK